MAKEIEVTIDQDGNAEIDMIGWHGKGCGDVSKQLEKALGKTVKSDVKSEYYKTTPKQKQKIVRGM
jgi:hypothetical protein